VSGYNGTFILVLKHLIESIVVLTLKEKPHFSTCLRRLKVSFATIFDLFDFSTSVATFGLLLELASSL